MLLMPVKSTSWRNLHAQRRVGAVNQMAMALSTRHTNDILGVAWGVSLICIQTTLSSVIVAHGKVEGTSEYTEDYDKSGNEP